MKAKSFWFQGLYIYNTPLCLLRTTLASISLPEIGFINVYNQEYNLNEVPDFRLNILVVEFTITSALSFVISPIATWKVIAPIFISYTVGQGQVTDPKIPEKKGDGWRSSWLLQEKHEGSLLSSFPLEINPNIVMSPSLLSCWVGVFLCVYFFKEIRKQYFVAVGISTFSQLNRMRNICLTIYLSAKVAVMSWERKKVREQSTLSFHADISWRFFFLTLLMYGWQTKIVNI